MWPLEQPLVIVLIGIAVGVVVGGLWTASGRQELLYALGAVVALTSVWLIVERLVVTDREAIAATLAEIARDVESNDLNRLVTHIAKRNPSLVQRAKAEMPSYDFTECRVTKIHLTDIDASAEPRSAIVEFNVIASGTFRRESVEVSDTVPRWVQLQMVREEDGQWRVLDYQHAEPQTFLFGHPVNDFSPSP
jgi:low affinity Fe/Cu permease